MAWISQKRQMNNFYRKIDKIAKKGSDNFIKYRSFVDDCITRNQYWLLTQVLYHHYNFDTEDYLSVDDMKAPSWSAIIKNTLPSLQENKYEIMNKRGVYQLGITYYEELPVTATYTNPLGTIEEVDYFEEDIDGLSPSELQKIIGNKKTYLVATLTGATSSASFSTWATQSRYDKNIIKLYKQAFDYLI
jgi:hypothetical protein